MNAELERIWLLVEYDGSAFHGSQFQSKDGQILTTVQGAIRQALNQLGFASQIKVHCASRTDGGVHAAGQIVQLTGPATLLRRIPDLRKALNSQLPAALAVVDVERGIPLTRCCQASAKVRWYRYRIDTRPGRHVWNRANRWALGQRLDIAAMQAAASAALGWQDFATFASVNTARALDTRCELRAFSMHEGDDGQIIVDIAAARFLYKMVRNLTAALVRVGQVRVGLSRPTDSASQMRDWLATRSRQAAPWSAPPQGLTLMAIAYESGPGKPTDPHPDQQVLDTGFFSRHVYARLLNTVLNLEISQHEDVFRQVR